MISAEIAIIVGFLSILYVYRGKKRKQLTEQVRNLMFLLRMRRIEMLCVLFKTGETGDY